MGGGTDRLRSWLIRERVCDPDPDPEHSAVETVPQGPVLSLTKVHTHLLLRHKRSHRCTLGIADRTPSTTQRGKVQGPLLTNSGESTSDHTSKLTCWGTDFRTTPPQTQWVDYSLSIRLWGVRRGHRTQVWTGTAARSRCALGGPSPLGLPTCPYTMSGAVTTFEDVGGRL